MDMDKNGIKGMRRTQKYTKFGRMFKAYLSLTMEVLITYSQYLCFLFMIVSMMVNAGLISLLYPFMVLGYGIMEEYSPRKRFWKITMLYTVFLIVLKFIY